MQSTTGLNAKAAGAGHAEISVAGKAREVASTCIEGRTVIVDGHWLKTARIFDEEFIEGEGIRDPQRFVAQLRGSGIAADLFTFSQRIPDREARYPYTTSWENYAVIPITTYAEWHDSRIESDVKKGLRKSKRLGVEARLAEFDEAFVEGIKRIYDETPVRQGAPFWHYQKDLETVRRENSTYLDRSAFVGAYFEGELIGFIRMVYVDKVASTLQVISQVKHFDKKPSSALIAKAVEICAEKGMTHLVYGSYVYNNAENSLTEFKRRNGFEKMLIPQYFIPLTLKGKLALRFGVHRPASEWIPAPVLPLLRKLRRRK